MLIDNEALKRYLSEQLDEPVQTFHNVPASRRKIPKSGKAAGVARMWYQFQQDVGDRFPPGTTWGSSEQFMAACEHQGWRIIETNAHDYNMESYLLREILLSLQKEFPQSHAGTKVVVLVDFATFYRQYNYHTSVWNVRGDDIPPSTSVATYQESIEVKRFGIKARSPKGTTLVYCGGGYSPVQDTLYFKVLDVINDVGYYPWEG